jgi:hypothetical protein
MMIVAYGPQGPQVLGFYHVLLMILLLLASIFTRKLIFLNKINDL